MNYEYYKYEMIVLWTFIGLYVLSKIVLMILNYTNTQLHVSITLVMCFCSIMALNRLENFYKIKG